MSVSKEQWNEPEAIVLLQHAGKLVAGFKSTGVQIPNRLQYHARLVAAHDAKDMAAYRTALNGYVEAAREAYRKMKGRRDKA
jgi:DNA-binding FadR family transcriptional regulator